MVANPIVQRELVGILRTRWALVVQLVCPVVFASLVLLRWPTDQQVDLAGSRAQEIFQLFGYGLLTVSLLLAPAFAATSIVRERTGGTLSELLNTPMSASSIYFGKLAGASGFVVLPLILSLPAVAAAYALGGLSATSDVIPLYAILLAANLQLVVIGLWVSSLARSNDSALRITYGLVLMLAIGSMVPYQLLQGRPPGWSLSAAEWMRTASPIAAVMDVVGHGDVGGQGLIGARGIAAWHVVLATTIAAVLAIHTIWQLKPTFQDRPRPQGVITEERSRGQRLLRRLLFISDPQRRTRPIGRYENPVTVKEFRSRTLGRAQWTMRMVALCAVASLTLTFVTATGTITWGVETIGALMVVLQSALIAVMTPALAAGLISAERECGSWTILLMTPLSPQRIVLGKLASVAWPVALLLLATLPGYAVMMIIQPVLQPQIVRVLVTLVLAAAAAVMISAAVSSLTAKTTTATLVAYLLIGVLWGGTLLAWVGRDRPFGHDLVESLLSVNPIAAAFSLIELPGFADYDLIPLNWGLMTLACVVAALVMALQIRRLTRPN